MHQRFRVELLMMIVWPVMMSGLSTSAQALEEQAKAARNEKPTVLVELFTSQSCSSCPPADRLISRLSRAARPGVTVTLSCHIDYWNHLGWKDPFSLKLCSERQESYAPVLDAGGEVYTPQLVIDGREECVGADGGCITAQIAAARARLPAADLSLFANPDAAGQTVQIQFHARMRRTLPGEPSLQGLVAVFENGLETAVKRGENAGQTLKNDFVVRRLEPVFSMRAVEGASADGELIVDWQPAWKLANAGIAAFLQDPESMAVYGATAASLKATDR